MSGEMHRDCALPPELTMGTSKAQDRKSGSGLKAEITSRAPESGDQGKASVQDPLGTRSASFHSKEGGLPVPLSIGSQESLRSAGIPCNQGLSDFSHEDLAVEYPGAFGPIACM